ncbi:MAG TPA: two-component regulator propeller domain-containing protein [Chthoniobacterales bacterium]
MEDIPRSEDYLLRSWGAHDGMPDLYVRGITQTPDGYLWLAALDGTTSFDGVRFTEIPNTSASRINGSSAVLAARDGTLWVATGDNGSLARLKGGTLQIEIPGPPNSDRPVVYLAEDAEGAIWVSTAKGGDVLRWKKGKADRFHAEDGQDPVSICAATNGVVWFTSYSHCGFFDGRKFQAFPLGAPGCGHLAPARAGGIWTVAGQQLLRFQENGRSVAVADLSWLGGADQVAALCEDREGNLWIGTQGVGLILFHDGKFERVPTPSPSIGCLYEDRSGDLWVGTLGGGLDCVSHRRIFTHMAPPDRSSNPVGPRDPGVGAMVVDDKGLIWMAQGHSLVRATDATNRTFTVAPGWTGPYGIYALGTTPNGEIWTGGSGPPMLRCWKDKRFLSEIPLPGALASFLLGGEPNQIRAALKPNRGIYEYRGKGFQLVPGSSGIENAIALALDAQKRLWVGTANGRVYFQAGGRFEEVPMPDPEPGDMVSFIVPDGRDTVWIGCIPSGLYRWREGRIDKLPSDAGLPLHDLIVLQIDEKGNFWFGTFLGLFRVPRADLEAVLDGRQSTMRSFAYGPSDGLPDGAGFHYGFLHTSLCMPDGHLWFGTMLGGLEVLPENTSRASAPPAVLIEELVVRGKSIAIPPHGSAALTLPPQPGPIQIRYTLPELRAPAQVGFRYRLLGLGDDSWSSNGTQRIATFPNLPPGAYTFEVAATNPLDPARPKTASLSFAVRAAWWQTLWFRIASALAAALAIAGLVTVIVRRRMQARIRRLEQEHALDRERARIARDMHDELGARITQIMLINDAAKQKAHPDFDQISEAIRSVSSTLDQIVWTTNPRNDTLEGLVDYIMEFAEEYLAPTSIELHLDLPPEIPDRPLSSDKRHQILLAVKEALNNAVKYSGAAQVCIQIAIRGDELRIVIKDDGCGFEAGNVPRTSNGLVNMRQRMQSIGGEAHIESQPGSGTSITLISRL